MQSLVSYSSDEGTDDHKDGSRHKLEAQATTAADHHRAQNPQGSTNTSMDNIDLLGSDSRAAKRIAELDSVEETIAHMLHLAGCTLASLHPEPLSTFSSRVVSVGADDRARDDEMLDANEQKGSDFAKYAESFYATLHDVQLSLRTSIRHLRMDRASVAPVLDPNYGSLQSPSGRSQAVGGGGVALGQSLQALKPEQPAWNGTLGPKAAPASPDELSVNARVLQREAWADLAKALADR
ncbi:hypothetical protein ACM66B_005472 [Microbotryomycetes sp. NB124-2]